MRVVLTNEGFKKFVVLIALQAVQDSVITAEYAGTIRRHETAVSKAFFNKCCDAFFAMAVEKYPSYVVVESETDVVDNIDVCLRDMLANGYLEYVVHRNLYVLSGLMLNTYYLATESNIQDFGCLVWGKAGLGATYQGFDQEPLPFDPGVTRADFYAQFPRHRGGGNDVVLCMAGADAIDLLCHGWDPHLRTLVEDFRIAYL